MDFIWQCPRARGSSAVIVQGHISFVFPKELRQHYSAFMDRYPRFDFAEFKVLPASPILPVLIWPSCLIKGTYLLLFLEQYNLNSIFNIPGTMILVTAAEFCKSHRLPIGMCCACTGTNWSYRIAGWEVLKIPCWAQLLNTQAKQTPLGKKHPVQLSLRAFFSNGATFPSVLGIFRKMSEKQRLLIVIRRSIVTLLWFQSVMDHTYTGRPIRL